MIFNTLSDRNNLLVPKPRVIPSYISVEDLYYRSDCEVFFNFSLFGYQTWIKKYYNKYRLYTRGFVYDFETGVSYANPYHDNVSVTCTFDLCVGHFYACCLSLQDAVRSNQFHTPINSFRHWSDSELARRSRFVSDIFKLDLKLLPSFTWQGCLF